VNGLDKLGELIATLFIASLAWASGLATPVAPPGAAEASGTGAPAESRPEFMLGWAQSTDESAIQQVGEGNQTDPEPLDEGAPPAQDTGDAEGDVELLDQGAPPAAPADGAVAAPVETATTAPVEVAPAPPAETGVTYDTEPAKQTGPVLPPGFGTGRVHVSAGRSGFPPGLEDCHVGAVTGRAYVGIDCGDGGGDIVGHAPSFADFPFVPEAEFPFEPDDAFYTNSEFFGTGSEEDDDDSDDVVVSTGRRARDSASEEPDVTTTGNGSVELAQRTRDREPRVRTSNRDSAQTKSSKKNNNGNNAEVASNDNQDNKKKKAKAEGKKKGKSKAKNGKKQKASKDSKSKDSKNSKKKREKRRSSAKN
jgi:hypothetical protein